MSNLLSSYWSGGWCPERTLRLVIIKCLYIFNYGHIHTNNSYEWKKYFLFFSHGNFFRKKSACTGVRESVHGCARAKFGNLANFAVLRNCALVPPECRICAKMCTNRPKSGVFWSKSGNFFLKTVFFWLFVTSIAPGKKHAQGVLSAWEKPANLYSTKCRIFGPHPPVRSTVVGHPSPTACFRTPETRRPAGARVPDAATPVAPFYFFL
jgi:hypothetical protein